MSTQALTFCLLFLMTQLIILVKLHEEKFCGIPGTPAHGRVTVLKSSYPVGYKVQFACEQGLLMIGKATQKCLENGTWNGQVPFCVTPSPDSALSQSAVLSCGHQFYRAVDGDDETCVNVYVNGSSIWWAMNLSQLPGVTILEVLVKGDVPTDKTAMAHTLQIHLSDSMYDYSDYNSLKCEGRNPKIKWQKFSLRLQPTRQKKGRFLYLTNYIPANFSYIRICEIIFITKEHSNFLCGDPGVPLNGIVERTERHTASYNCQDNFDLVGPIVRTCNDDGVWSSPMPLCVARPITDDDVTNHSLYLYIAIGMGAFLIIFVIGFAFYFCHTQRRVLSNNISYSGTTNMSSIGETLFNETYCGSVSDDFPFTIINKYNDVPPNDIVASSRRNSRLHSCSSSSDRRASCKSDSTSKRISFCRVSSGSREKPPPPDIPRVHSNNSIQFPEGPHIYSEICEDSTLPTCQKTQHSKLNSNPSSPVLLNPVYLDPDDKNDQTPLPIYTEPYGTAQT